MHKQLHKCPAETLLADHQVIKARTKEIRHHDSQGVYSEHDTIVRHMHVDAEHIADEILVSMTFRH